MIAATLDAPEGLADVTGRDAREWRSGWPLLVVATLGAAVSTVGFISLGSLIRPLQAAHGWSRFDITLAGFIICVSTFLLAPLAGRLVDRFGVRPVVLCSALAFAAAQGLVGLATSAVWTWWAAWIVASIAMQGITPNIWAAAVVRHFTIRRGLALGVTMAGVGLANLAMPFIAATTLEAAGWRPVYFLIGGFSLLVLAPAIWLFVRPAAPAPQAVHAASEADAPGLSLSRALRGGVFWRLALAVVLVAATVGFLNLHMQEMLRDHGYSALAAAALAAFYGPAQIAGRLGAGYLLDRMSGPRVAAIIFLLPVASGWVLLQPAPAPWMVVLPSIFAGLAAGVEIDIMAYLTSRYFGLRHYGQIYGALFGVFSLAFGFGPLLVGAVRDLVGSYDPALIACMIALPVASLAALTLGRYRY